jgi:FKBP-type peptidyl-prolyl cis-trans isomerase
MKYILTCLVLGCLIASCDTSGVKKNDKVVSKIEPTSKDSNILDGEYAVIDQKKFSNGIKIEWFEKGSGANVASGDLVIIDFKVKLKDGKVVDGNHLIHRTAIPFLVGFGMQTEGWDIALKELKVGDFAKILIPSPFARGEKGIEGLIPRNADNFLIIRIIENKKPTRVVAGTKVWLLEENTHNKLKFNEKCKMEFHAMASTSSTAMFVNTYRNNQPFQYKLTDHGLVPGLRNALINAKKSDRMFILVPSSEAYGTAGYLDFVKPGEDVFYNVLVMDVSKI